MCPGLLPLRACWTAKEINDFTGKPSRNIVSNPDVTMAEDFHAINRSALQMVSRTHSPTAGGRYVKLPFDPDMVGLATAAAEDMMCASNLAG